MRCRVTPSIKFAGTHLYSWVGERHCENKVSCPRTTQCPRPGFEAGPLDLEMCALFMRPTYLYYLLFITHAQYGAWVKDWAPFLRFGVTFVHANLCLHTLTPSSLGWEGVGDYLKYSPVAAKIFLWCWKTCGKIWKKRYCLKMYIYKEHHFWGYDKNTVRTTSNQPSVPCFKPLLRREVLPRNIAWCYMSRFRAGIFQLLRGCTWMFSLKLD